MKDSCKEKFVALVSRKEPLSSINVSDVSDQGEENGEDLTDELVANTSLIVRRYEENNANRFRRPLPKNGNSTRRFSSEKKGSDNCFNYCSPDQFSRDCKEKKEAQSPENYEELYKKLIAHLKKENISFPKAFIAKQEIRETWDEDEDTSEDKKIIVKGLMALVNDNSYITQADGSQADIDVYHNQELNVDHMRTWVLDNECSCHLTGFKSLL